MYERRNAFTLSFSFTHHQTSTRHQTDFLFENESWNVIVLLSEEL